MWRTCFVPYNRAILFTLHILLVLYKCRVVENFRGVGVLVVERECRLPVLLYADDFALCGELEEDLKVMSGVFC